MKKRQIILQFVAVCLLVLMLCLAITSCKENNKRKEVEQIITEWIGKEIRFPADVQCSLFGRDTTAVVCSGLLDAEYKLLLYVDSTGCTSCKLRLHDWKQLMTESDSPEKGRLSYLFFFHPKDKKELQFLFKRDGWKHPVFIDSENHIQQLNHFPEKPEYQCFLLDKNNQVIMVGNPVNNRGVWKLYKELVFGKQQETATVTTAKWEKTQHIATSCGCTSVNWDKHPVKPQETANIEVEMIPVILIKPSKCIVTQKNRP